MGCNHHGLVCSMVEFGKQANFGGYCTEYYHIARHCEHSMQNCLWIC